MSARATIAERMGFRALEALRGGALELRYPNGLGRRFGDGAGDLVRVDVHRPEALWDALARRTRVGIGESYVAGHWDCDDLVGLFALLGRNLEATSNGRWRRWLHRLQELRPHRSQKQSLDAARSSVQAHYDLGNELFELMLDPTMTYSCAYWERPEQSLEEAQRAKLRRVCEKLRLGPGDHVLEIGCGWGSFAILAAREYGCRVTGLTLSPSQASLAQRRVDEAGLAERVRIVERDYRHVTDTYSRVASIEMLEAIGHEELDGFFAAVNRLLEPDGIAVVQTISIPDDRYERYRRTADWIQLHVFPGGHLPSLERIARSVARTRLMITGVEEIGIGYARTLREWRQNVFADVDRVEALGYDERFLRLWRFYLTYCEAAFAIRSLRDVQLVLTRAFNDGLPAHPTPGVSY